MPRPAAPGTKGRRGRAANRSRAWPRTRDRHSHERGCNTPTTPRRVVDAFGDGATRPSLDLSASLLALLDAAEYEQGGHVIRSDDVAWVVAPCARMRPERFTSWTRGAGLQRSGWLAFAQYLVPGSPGRGSAWPYPQPDSTR